MLYNNLFDHIHGTGFALAPLSRLQELSILVSDDADVFNKDFLYRLQPFACLFHLPCLKKLTVPWQAICAIDHEKSSMTDLPTSLQTLRILYPHAQTPTQLLKLLEDAPTPKISLQSVELLFDDDWGMTADMMRAFWQRVLDEVPANVAYGKVLSVMDQLNSLYRGTK